MEEAFDQIVFFPGAPDSYEEARHALLPAANNKIAAVRMELLLGNPRYLRIKFCRRERCQTKQRDFLCCRPGGLANPAKTLFVSYFKLASRFEDHSSWRHRIANEAHLSSRRLLRR